MVLLTTREQQLLSLILLKPAGIFIHAVAHGSSMLSMFLIYPRLNHQQPEQQALKSGELRSFECGVRVFSKFYLHGHLKNLHLSDVEQSWGRREGREKSS